MARLCTAKGAHETLSMMEEATVAHQLTLDWCRCNAGANGTDMTFHYL